MKYAQLDERGLEKVQVLEEEMGSVVLVMERQLPAAKLTDQQVERIQALEKELGVILIAYRA
jgi:hypothetical protein